MLILYYLYIKIRFIQKRKCPSLHRAIVKNVPGIQVSTIEKKTPAGRGSEQFSHHYFFFYNH